MHSNHYVDEALARAPYLERRQARRQDCAALAASCQSLTVRGMMPLRVSVANVSADGLGLLTPEPMQPGTVVVLKFSDHAGPEPVVAVLRVQHSAPAGNGHWVIGGRLAQPLNAAQLTMLAAG